MNEPLTTVSASDILSAEDFEYDNVPVPEWGGNVRLKSMTADTAIKFTEGLKTPSAQKNSNVKILLLSIVDDDGHLLFTETQLAELRVKSLKIINMLANRALVLNGMGEEAEKEEGLGED